MTAPTFVPRYIRRHYKAVMAVPFTWRTTPTRRERKISAKLARLNARYRLNAAP